MKRINWLKPLFLYGMMGLLFAGMFSCNDNNKPDPIYRVTVTLVYPGDYPPVEGIMVKLENPTSKLIFEEPTNASGVAEFYVIAGTYTASASESRVVDLVSIIFSGSVNQFVSEECNINLPLEAIEQEQICIKELYIGGCQNENGTSFQYDSYVILYNNSGEPATLKNTCLGMVNPYNSNGTNNDYVDGALKYANQGWIPAGQAIWAFPQSVTIDPGKQIVIALKNAIDNTPTVPNAINFNNSAYYCTYDPEVFPNETYYKPPAPAIPSSHYLKAYFWGAGNAWTLSVTSPAFFIFAIPEGLTPQAFVDDIDSYQDQYNNSATAANARRKVSVDWVIDGIEVYNYGAANNSKRLTPAVDAGYVEHRSQYGFTLYRNVDKEATEALPENEGKIVYGYSLGTVGYTIPGLEDGIIDGSTDPSGIDAEASIQNGARIVYKDTNNSSNDFHMRSRASLKD